MTINENELADARVAWGNGMIAISKAYEKSGIDDATIVANEMLDQLYGFEFGPVLFKPTLAKEIQFRNSKDAALSYFIGNNSNFSEDNGFALKGWSNVKWENSGIQLFENIAIAMGNYYFTNNEGTIKVEFSFVYKKDNNGDLRIILHDSHLPYQG